MVPVAIPRLYMRGRASRYPRVPGGCGGGGTGQVRVPEVDVLGGRRAPWARVCRGPSLGSSWEREGGLGLQEKQGRARPGFPANGKAWFASRGWTQAVRPVRARMTEQGAPKPSPSTKPIDSGTGGTPHGYYSALVGARPARQLRCGSSGPADRHTGQIPVAHWAVHGSCCVHARAGVDSGSAIRQGVKVSWAEWSWEGRWNGEPRGLLGSAGERLPFHGMKENGMRVCT